MAGTVRGIEYLALSSSGPMNVDLCNSFRKKRLKHKPTHARESVNVTPLTAQSLPCQLAIRL